MIKNSAVGKILLVVLTLVVLTSCYLKKETMYTYTFELEVTYENGDEETLKITKDSYQQPELWLIKGCVKVAYRNNRFRQDTPICYVRKYKVIDYNKQVSNGIKIK